MYINQWASIAAMFLTELFEVFEVPKWSKTKRNKRLTILLCIAPLVFKKTTLQK